MKLNTLVRHSLLLTSMALVAVSCSQNGEHHSSLAFDTYTGTSSYTLEGSGKAFMQDSDLVYMDSVSLILPLRMEGCDLQSVRDTICSYALGIVGKPIVNSINTWMTDMAKDQGYPVKKYEGADGPDVAQGFDIVNGFITNLTPQLMVYCVRTDSYTAGAAHGMSVRRYINFSIEGAGKVITLNDLFTTAGLKKLPEAIADQAQAMSDQIGATTVSALPEDNNFYISSEGEIVFSYAPYEIASYAQGTIDIPFYPYELVDYMTPYAIELFNLGDLND